MTPAEATPAPRCGRAPAAGRLDALTLLMLIVAGAQIARYVWVALARMSYPFELEWIEGAGLEQVRRVLAGQPLFVAPSLEYVPSNYTPLYFHVAAGFARILGADFLALRMVSFLASLACFALLGLLVWRETRSRGAALLAVGMFCATYRTSATWFDLARADSLYLALMLAGVCALRLDASRWRAPVAAGVLFTLAFLTKQSAPVVMSPLLLYLVVTDRARGVTALAVMLALVAASVLALERASGGWFSYYVFRVAASHELDRERLWLFLQHDMLRVALVVAVIGVALARRVTRPRPFVLGFYATLLAGFLGSAWQLRVYPGGHVNSVLTAYLGVAIALGIAWGGLTSGQAVATTAGRRLFLWSAAALILQLGVLFWGRRDMLPTAMDRRAGDELVARLKSAPGPVLVPYHPYLLTRAGRPPHFHAAPFLDVVGGGHGPVERRLLQSLRDTLAAHVYPVVILDQAGLLLDEARAAGYEIRDLVFPQPGVFWPVAGADRPEWVLTPVTAPAAGPRSDPHRDDGGRALPPGRAGPRPG